MGTCWGIRRQPFNENKLTIPIALWERGGESRDGSEENTLSILFSDDERGVGEFECIYQIQRALKHGDVQRGNNQNQSRMGIELSRNQNSTVCQYRNLEWAKSAAGCGYGEVVIIIIAAEVWELGLCSGYDSALKNIMGGGTKYENGNDIWELGKEKL